LIDLVWTQRYTPQSRWQAQVTIAPTALPTYQAQTSCKPIVSATWRHMEGVWVQLHSFLTSALDGD